jgi:hypothetical protein
VRDISSRYRILLDAPIALAGLLASVAIAAGLAMADVITGWGLTVTLAVALVSWPQLAELLVARRRPRVRDLEWAGVDSALTADELVAIDRALALREVGA